MVGVKIVPLMARHGEAIDRLLLQTSEQAEAIGLSGTPAIIVGRYLVPGAVDFATLKQVVASARSDAGASPERAS